MNDKLKLILIVMLNITFFTNAQTVTTISGDYKVIDIGDNGAGDYVRNLILIHEMYNNVALGMNSAVGTITALRGSVSAGNRMNVVEIKSSSSYMGTVASIKSIDDYSSWTLKTCIYNGKKYLAVDVPYMAAYHTVGYKFIGQTTSTGVNMKSVNYEVNGQPVNTSILSNIQDFVPNMNEVHNVNNFLIIGNNVGIGTTAPDSKLTVAGNIHAREVKITTSAGTVPDYVFANDYKLKSLDEVEAYIKKNSHLPEIPSAQEIEKNGLMLAEMNLNLLKKIEELTLYIIEQNKKNEEQSKEIESLRSLAARVLKIENELKQK